MSQSIPAAETTQKGNVASAILHLLKDACPDCLVSITGTKTRESVNKRTPDFWVKAGAIKVIAFTGSLERHFSIVPRGEADAARICQRLRETLTERIVTMIHEPDCAVAAQHGPNADRIECLPHPMKRRTARMFQSALMTSDPGCSVEFQSLLSRATNGAELPAFLLRDGRILVSFFVQWDRFTFAVTPREPSEMAACLARLRSGFLAPKPDGAALDKSDSSHDQGGDLVPKATGWKGSRTPVQPHKGRQPEVSRPGQLAPNLQEQLDYLFSIGEPVPEKQAVRVQGASIKLEKKYRSNYGYVRLQQLGYIERETRDTVLVHRTPPGQRSVRPGARSTPQPANGDGKAPSPPEPPAPATHADGPKPILLTAPCPISGGPVTMDGTADDLVDRLEELLARIESTDQVVTIDDGIVRILPGDAEHNLQTLVDALADHHFRVRRKGLGPLTLEHIRRSS